MAQPGDPTFSRIPKTAEVIQTEATATAAVYLGMTSVTVLDDDSLHIKRNRIFWKGYVHN